MNNADRQYLEVMDRLLTKGVYREGRNGGTYGLFGEQLRFDLSEGFPLLTTKKVHFRSIVVELLWFLRGDTNIKYLHDHGVTIWDEWADEDGELGPIYPAQWRSFNSGYSYGVDQISELIAGLRKDPHGRRHLVSAWHPADVLNMTRAGSQYTSPPPCHCLFQFHVAEGRLSCQLYQRSADWFLGVPFNIASYALLTHLIAKEVGLDVGDFVHSFGDLHLYANHVDQARMQFGREPRDLPVLTFPGNGHTVEQWPGIFNLEPASIRVECYDPHPAIKAPVSK